MSDRPKTLRPLSLYITPAHPCNYLPDRQAKTVFVDPLGYVDVAAYTRLAAAGFRRSGTHFYRPRCDDCAACVSVRIPVEEFRPNRSQARTWRANKDLVVVAKPARFEREQFLLYSRYMERRHPGGGMDGVDPATYIAFLASPWPETVFYEFRLAGELLAVAVVDHLEDALSAVYTFFEPDLPQRALGVYAVLWQIERARCLGRSRLYLGYWIEQSAKMRYKARYRPFEAYLGGGWVHIGPDDPLPRV
jgi:arginine-tRNA-protein transferase